MQKISFANLDITIIETVLHYIGEPCKLHLQPMRGKGKRPTENKNRESSNEQSVSEPVIMTRTRYKGIYIYSTLHGKPLLVQIV